MNPDPLCPCGSNDVKRHGWIVGATETIQRYRCFSCGRTFSAERTIEGGNRLHLDKALRLRHAFQQGMGTRASARYADCATGTAAVLRRQWGFVDALCACGGLATHRGWCSERVKKSPARLAFLCSWHRVHPDVEARAVQHIGFAKQLVTVLMKQLRVPAHVERDDLEGAALVGLWQAARRWVPTRGAAFKTFAALRIRGAVMDHMRAEGPLSRGDLAKVKAGDLSRARYIVSLDEMMKPDGDSDAVAWEPAAPERARLDPLLHDRVADAIVQLPDRDRLVVARYYGGDETMKEIGVALGVNESRVSQLHARAIDRLRESLREIEA